jgi:undecaprenyl-diphosphatase
MPYHFSSSSPQKLTVKRALVGAIFFGVGFTGFLSLHATITAQSGAPPIDQAALEWVASLRTPLFTHLALLFTAILSPIGLVILTIGGGAFWLWKTGELWRPILLLGAMASALLLTDYIKHLVARARPDFLYMIQPFELDFSFPSGHAISVATFTIILGYLAYSRHRTRSTLAFWGSIAGAGIAIGAWCRMYLGYHWLTDISASICLSLIVLAAIMLIDTLQPKATPSDSGQ